MKQLKQIITNKKVLKNIAYYGLALYFPTTVYIGTILYKVFLKNIIIKIIFFLLLSYKLDWVEIFVR